MGSQTLSDEGTTGDYFVSPSGSDANPGTIGSPKLTIQAAIDAAQPGQTVWVRGGTYPETADLSAKTGITVARYGAEVATISGQDLIEAGSWSSVNADDEPHLGVALVASGTVYKAIVPTSQIASGDPRAAFLHEGFTPLVPAQARLPSPAFPLSAMCEAQWLTSAVPTTDPLSTYVLPASHQGLGYTETQVLNADVLFHEGANFNKRRPVASYDAGTFTITPDYEGSFSRSGEAHKQDRFALINLLPAMTQGGWGYRVEGADTILYVWPNSAVSISNGTIGYSRRTKGIKGGPGCRVHGLHTFGHAAGGSDLAEGSASGIDAQGISDFRADDCFVESVWNPESGYGAVLVHTCDDVWVTNCAVKGAYGTFAYNVMGTFSGDWNTAMTAAQLGQRNKLHRCTAEDVEMSPIRWHSQSQGIVLDFKALWPCGTQAHANQVEAYIQTSRCAFVGLDFRGCYGGYSTIQSSSEVAFLACEMPILPGSYGRGFADQSSAVLKDPAALGVGTPARYMLSCRVTPHPSELEGGPLAGAVLGVGDGSGGNWIARGNILHGVSVHDDNGGAAGTGHIVNDNVITAGSSPPDSSGNTTPGHAGVYARAGAGDFTYLPSAAFRSAPRLDLSTEVAVIKAWFVDTGVGGTSGRLFTDAEFDIDVVGRPVDWASAPYGPFN